MDFSFMLRGRRILVVETNYYSAMELALSLHEMGATILGPVPSEDAALDILLLGNVDFVVFNAQLRDHRVALLAECLRRQNVPSMMVNDVPLSSGDSLCQGRPQMLHPVAHGRFHKVVEELLAM
ncbi:hypothetical protein BKE38_12560 [Pseudoroseomonas deserti]|uniref:Response regulatory domain-containing protein n=1 Tax=Teichococcus deserti TaxID=1817963 RepID=A0A1V2H2K4_9PROT|nr:hypothetical protein BKE38_12560 [Pseudoroseomonas deserti]